MRNPPCEVCRKFYEKKPVKPVCGKFKCGKGKLENPLLIENGDAFHIFSLVVNQATFAGIEGVPVDLDFQAVEFVMNLYEIENRRECFELVLLAWRNMAENNRAKRRSKT